MREALDQPHPLYVLVSHFDCVQVHGVYDSLEAAQQAADEDAEQPLTWQGLNTGEASHLIPPLDWWRSNTVELDGEGLSYTITARRLRRALAREDGGQLL